MTGVYITEARMAWCSVRRSGKQWEVGAESAVDRAGAGEDGGIPAGSRLPREHVTLCVPCRDLLMRVVALPDVPEAELGEMVALQVDKIAPFAAESMTHGFEVLHRADGGCRVLIVAAHRESLAGGNACLRAAGARPERIDAAGHAVFAVLRERGELREQGRQVYVVEQEAGFDLLVCDDGVPLALRVVAPEPGGEAAGVLLAEEINETLVSVELERGPAPLAGISAWLREEDTALAECLKERCGCWVAVKSAANAPAPAAAAAMRTAAGKAGLLDLTPPDWRAEAVSAQFKRRIVGSMLGVAAVWLLALGGVFGYGKYEEMVLARLQAESAKWDGPADEVRGLRRRVFVIREYMDRSHSALECLRTVTVAMPENMVLTSFTYEKGDKVNITGSADDNAQVTEFQKRLGEAGVFPKVVPETVTVGRDGKYRFELNLALPAKEQES